MEEGEGIGGEGRDTDKDMSFDWRMLSRSPREILEKKAEIKRGRVRLVRRSWRILTRWMLRKRFR